MVSSYEMYEYCNHLGMFSHICLIVSKTVGCVLNINYNIHLFLLLLSELFFPLTFEVLRLMFHLFKSFTLQPLRLSILLQ